MQKRIPLNSKSLQEKFPDIYQNFFAKCPLVVSAPRHVMWMGEYTVRHGGVAMHQILPNRGYVGLIPQKNKKKIKVVDYQVYNPEKQSFENQTFDEHQTNNIENNLSLFFEKTCGLKIDCGFDIHILLELPLDHALGRAGVIMAPMITAFLLYYNLISIADIESWSTTPLAELIQNSKTKFDFVFRILWKWEVFNYTIGSATSSFCSLTPSKTPLLFFSHRNDEAISEMIKNKLKKNNLQIDDLKFIDSSYYWGARTNEFFGEHVGWPWPFDWGIIHTGGMLDVLNLEFLIEDKQKELRDNANEVAGLFQIVLGNKNINDQPEFYRLCNDGDTQKKLWYGFIGSLQTLSLQLLLKLKHVLEEGFSQKLFSELVNAMDKVHSTLHCLFFHTADDTAIKTDGLLKTFFEKRIGRNSFGTKISSFSTHGSLIFAVPSLVARPWTKEMIKTLQTNVNDKISFDYLSWEDVSEDNGGVRIEQNLTAQVFSRFIPNDVVAVVEYNRNGKNDIMLSAEQLKKIPFDVILDVQHDKISIMNRSVTAKTLPSQKATIEIICFLLEHLGVPVSNKDLPMKTYSSYRNEFQGKISGPLTNLLGDKIKIKIAGELMNFTVCLTMARGTKIAILKKI